VQPVVARRERERSRVEPSGLLYAPSASAMTPKVVVGGRVFRIFPAHRFTEGPGRIEVAGTQERLDAPRRRARKDLPRGDSADRVFEWLLDDVLWAYNDARLSSKCSSTRRLASTLQPTPAGRPPSGVT
jgi:hypothetical protein